MRGGRPVRKDHPRLAVCGDLDEACACVGAALAALPRRSSVRDILKAAQQALMFSCGVAAQPGAISRRERARLAEKTRDLEKRMARLSAKLKPAGGFVMPGATQAGAWLHVARTVCRRAERAVVSARLDPALGSFLNRLSSALFLAARWADEGGVRP